MEKKTILIVDDDKSWINILAMRLQSEGYEVRAAFDAVSGMMQTVKERPDLMILDILMPAGGGFTLLKNLKDNVTTFSLHIIVLSNKADDATKNQAEKFGISGFFPKTIELAKLMLDIKKILESRV